MGIDIYARWRGITKDEEEKQYTGFSTTAGDVGYLREAYHGTPYATRELLPEAFDSPDGVVPIPAKTLRERLPKVLELVAERARKLYSAGDEEVKDTQKAFIDFVELCEKKEAETGQPVEIHASY